MTDRKFVDTLFSIFVVIFYGTFLTSLLYAAAQLGYLTPGWLKALFL